MFGGLLLRAIIHAHGIAAFRRQLRGCGADAAAAAGDDHHTCHRLHPIAEREQSKTRSRLV
jgi:hypothetical protein